MRLPAFLQPRVLIHAIKALFSRPVTTSFPAPPSTLSFPRSPNRRSAPCWP